ncbi:hypothetical protein BV372_32805 [Nostoc sp. T09]|nr:hypothetical protein BV372_32805 [Nostoc sp. T09]
MNSPPRPPTTINSRGRPKEFQQIIQAKSHNFVGREFVFTAIHEFIHQQKLLPRCPISSRSRASKSTLCFS